MIRFDLAGKTYEVIDAADTTYAGSTVETDQCDIDGRGHVLTSNCETGSMGLYRIVDDKIRHMRDLATGLSGNFCHGARFCGPGVVVATTLRDPMGAHFFDLQTMRKLLYVRTDHPCRDLCFLPDGHAALVVSSATPRGDAYEIGTSEIVLVALDLGRRTYCLVGKQVCGDGQLDAIIAYGRRLFITDSYVGCVRVVDARTLRQIDQLDYDFPHGVDVNHGMMAVACYGTNSIHVRATPAR
jgi:hypothetical protein